MLGLKVLAYQLLYDPCIVILTTEDIYVAVARLITEMPSYIACLYQLHESQSSFIATPEPMDLRLSERHHVNLPDKIL